MFRRDKSECKVTTKPVKRVPLAKRVVIEKHSHGPLKGRVSKWYWACAVCGLVYITKGSANFCCADHKDHHWLKTSMRPLHDAIGKIVDGEFTRFKEGVK